MKKSAMLEMKSYKRDRADKMELLNQEKIRTHGEKETLGLLETDTIKPVNMKEKIKKEYLCRTRKLLETKLCSRNLVKGINTWALLVRYSRPFLKWTREKLKQMNSCGSLTHITIMDYSHRY